MSHFTGTFSFWYDLNVVAHLHQHTTSDFSQLLTANFYTGTSYETFKLALVEAHGPEAIDKLLLKQLRPILSAEQMVACNIQLVLQMPGQMVVTPPVRILHILKLITRLASKH